MVQDGLAIRPTSVVAAGRVRTVKSAVDECWGYRAKGMSRSERGTREEQTLWSKSRHSGLNAHWLRSPVGSSVMVRRTRLAQPVARGVGSSRALAPLAGRIFGDGGTHSARSARGTWQRRADTLVSPRRPGLRRGNPGRCRFQFMRHRAIRGRVCRTATRRLPGPPARRRPARR